jgi:acetyl-CoA acyltransferase
MAEPVLIAGAGMTPFAKSPGVGVRKLAVAATDEALVDAGIGARDVSKIYFGNAAAGTVSHQEMIRGQVAFRESDLASTPLINVENACASGGSALHLAFESIASGSIDVALVVGAEQLTHHDRARTFAALRGSTDIDEIGEEEPDEPAVRSVLMDFYAQEAARYIAEHGASAGDLARVAVKNRHNASMNPLAHFRRPQTVEQVLAGRTIAAPLTLPMCAPTTDGAAALVLCSRDYARRIDGGAKLEVASCSLGAPAGRGISPVVSAANDAYEGAAVGPDDLDLVELHDAAAPAELLQYAEIGLCDEGDGHRLLRRGDTEIGGRIPVNASGGLLSRGHPLGATGCAQVVELCAQLRDRAGERQLEHARVGMAINGGGWLDGTYAVAVATIVRRAA